MDHIVAALSRRKMFSTSKICIAGLILFIYLLYIMLSSEHPKITPQKNLSMSGKHPRNVQKTSASFIIPASDEYATTNRKGKKDKNNNTDAAEGNSRRVLIVGAGLSGAVPVNIKTVNAVFNLTIETETQMKDWLKKHQITPPSGKATNSEETAKSRVGERLYELLFKDYTKKQWDKYPAELKPSVLERIPVRSNADGRYFHDTHQALPSRGYTRIFKRMLDTPAITVKLNTEFFTSRKRGTLGAHDYLFFTGPIDRYFESSGLPALEYRSLEFHREVFNTTNGGYTRIFKRMLDTPAITVKLNTEFFTSRKRGTLGAHDYLFFTGPIDRYFESSGLPALEYRSLEFHREVFNTTNGFVN
ncbi:unnamed protein product [Notodromas monacha]|uniref:UDP-galactopyranose mutase C-terminal domain-containing protein n=1 Tax=Notodromas monacha TaxID=399045 RepID=A0A7R9GH73_9CRUS|nr:unnamed protein product [Notodromas monacha]CAG0922580.1 unnamed protein product [Notodromas monacha]